MSKWSRLNTTIKLAFGMEDIGNAIEPAVNLFSPVANLTTQGIDAAGDYLPKSYVDEAQSAYQNLKNDSSARIVDDAINSLYESDFYKDYKGLNDPVSISGSKVKLDPTTARKRLRNYGLDLSDRANATPLRKALNSIRAERHLNTMSDDLLRGTLASKKEHLPTKEHLDIANQVKKLDHRGKYTEDKIMSAAKEDVLRGITPFNRYTDSSIIPKNADDFNKLMLKYDKEKPGDKMPITDTIGDFEGINNPEFLALRQNPGTMSNFDFRDYANSLRKRYGDEFALDVINARISGDDLPSLADLKNYKR